MRNLKIAFTSDFHLFHIKTPTAKIVEEFKTLFPLTLTDYDILFIAGDLLDRLMTIPKTDNYHFDEFMVYLLNWSKKTDTLIRILEGTPSHDWNQSQRLIRINELFKVNADIAYFKELSIEYIPRFKINVLYVPDEWRPDPETTLAEVKALVLEKGLDKVDFAIMHGQFHYQLPEVAKAPKHKEEEYLNLVNYFISIGHVHKHSHYKRILAQGSFSRLIHGEEEPKGYISASINGSKLSWKFIENKDATIYKTIDLTHLQPEESLKKIEREISLIPSESHVRLLMEKKNPYLNQLKELNKKYPFLNWSIKINTEVETEATPVQEETTIQSLLNVRNIEDQLLDRLKSKNLDIFIINKAETIIKECLNDIRKRNEKRIDRPDDW